MSEYKFYYSNDCLYSQELANKMIKKNVLHKFSIINVDNDFIPQFLNSVPTIVIPHLGLLEGIKAFKWIEGCHESFIQDKFKKYDNKVSINRLFEKKAINDLMKYS